MCISATAARAFKSVLQGIYSLQKAVLALLPVTLVMEPDVISLTLTLAEQHQYMWILLLVNSAMAYSANLLNFLVTKHTSALTLQVLGNAKGAVAVVISILIFQNPVTVMGIGGYSITVLGVVAYGETKRRFRYKLFSNVVLPSPMFGSSSVHQYSLVRISDNFSIVIFCNYLILTI
ncbi:hypothetical protein Bca52824_005772 [Brassica carinata]|uniref:Sugar phosphate transporter domain-containing protein n=1 Tax=Brassica carinata TaxID=52824 RepID=A0A8X7WS34_BRACI|nr:hypothetical protein Bca52824_005772 [Brassica carinata]